MPVHRSCFRPWILAALILAMLAPYGVLAQNPAEPPCAWNQPTTREAFTTALHQQFALTEPADHGGTLTFAETNLTTTLVPLATNNFQARTALSWVYEPLVGRSPIDGQPMPRLADSWEISPDGKTFTFHLNRDATWHDGVDFTAEDVKFTYDAAIEGDFTRKPDHRMFSSADIVDDDTIRLTGKDAFATFLQGAAILPIMPKHVWDSIPYAEWTANTDVSLAIGTGPFKLVEYAAGERMRYASNEDYYGVVPAVAELVMEQVAQGSNLIEKVAAGEIDFVETSNEREIRDYVDSGRLNLSNTFRTYRMLYYAYNTSLEQFSDPRVRRALFIAIDRDAVLDAASINGEVAVGTQPLLSCAYAPDAALYGEHYPRDIARAKALLAEAGWHDTDGDRIVEKHGEPFEIQLLYNQELPDGPRIVNQIRADWAEVGVRFREPRAVPFETARTLIGNKNYQIALRFQRWDPSGNQGILFGSGQDHAIQGYEAADWDQMTELDQAARREKLIALSNLVWDDLSVGVLYFYRSMVAYNPKIQNFYPNDYAGTYWSLPYVWIDE